MATEPNVLPGVETETAPETVEPEVTAPEVGADADEADGEVKAEKSETKDPNDAIERMQRRINKKHAVAAKALAENEYLKRQLDELRSKESGQAEKHDDPDIEALVEYKAKIREFTRTSNQLVEEGSKAHTDYMNVLKDLASEVGDFVKRDGTPSSFMEVVLEVADKPTELLYYLGKNPDIAADLTELSPTRLAKKLDRIERDLVESSKPVTSKAPKPLETVKSQASSGPRPDGSYDDFLKWRKQNKGTWR